MSENTLGPRASISRLILIPTAITLGVTLLRLVGELAHWSRVLFNPEAGGGAAIVGISWLPFIFGPYFAVKLRRAGDKPSSPGKAIGFAVLGLVISFGGAFLAFAPKPDFPGKIGIGLLILAAGAALQFVPWPSLAKTLLAYGYAARIPVAVVMFFAIRGSWGTHYDALPPEPVPTAFWPRYIEIGLAPQLIFWVAYTILTGVLFGVIVVAIVNRSKPAGQPAAG